MTRQYEILTNEKNLKIEDIKFWTHNDGADLLYCKTVESAINYAIDEHESNIINLEDENFTLKPLTLYGFIPKVIDFKSLAERVQDLIVEHIDENYMYEDGIDLSDEQKLSVENFIKDFTKDIEVCSCDEVMSINVEVTESDLNGR